ncbi:MAG TPA: (2Fe-2S) ferredoxin domain-containing protein [Herpetosiphonaceae bacterium]
MGKKEKKLKKAIAAAAATAVVEIKPKVKKLKKGATPATAVVETQPKVKKLEGSDKKLKNTVRKYVQHILVCTDSKSKECKKGGPEVLKAFEKAIKSRKLGRQVMVSEVGHVGGCGLGPNVIVYPEGVWYGRVEPEDVDEIIDEHILEGRVVQRLLRGQRQDDPCGGCILTKPLVVAAQQANEALN